MENLGLNAPAIRFIIKGNLHMIKLCYIWVPHMPRMKWYRKTLKNFDRGNFGIWTTSWWWMMCDQVLKQNLNLCSCWKLQLVYFWIFDNFDKRICYCINFTFNLNFVRFIMKPFKFKAAEERFKEKLLLMEIKVKLILFTCTKFT